MDKQGTEVASVSQAPAYLQPGAWSAAPVVPSPQLLAPPTPTLGLPYLLRFALATKSVSPVSREREFRNHSKFQQVYFLTHVEAG